MHVGFALYGDIETNTGGFRYDRKLIEGLRECGDRVDVVSLPWRSSLTGMAEGLFGRLPGCLDAPFDVLIEDELANPTLVGLNRRLRARRDVPIVTVVHHLRCSEARPAWRNRCHRALERRYLAGVDAAICNSAATRATVTDLASLQTRVIQPAGDRFDSVIDDAIIAARAREPGPLRICFLGSLVPRKGLHTLIEALARLPDEQWRLRVVGRARDPKYAQRVEHLVAQWGLDGVSFAGELPDEMLATELERSHVLAIPSTHEGFGIAYLEGMGFGLPALASAAGGARAIVSHGENGYLLARDSPGALAHRVRTLAVDRTRLARMGIAARRRYEAQPTWTENTGRVRAFLRGIVLDSPGNNGETHTPSTKAGAR